MKTNPALSALRHHVTGAIARGEAQAITEVPATPRQHTPGPWEVDGQYVHGPDGRRFLAVAGDGEGIANARLIAAAPDLLAALRKALEWVEHVQSVAWDSIPEGMRGDNGAAWAIRSAIARATGGGK